MAFFISFFFNDTATTEIYTLSLHDALPISALLLPLCLCTTRHARGASGLFARGGCAGCPIFSEFMSYFSLYILQEMSIEKQSIKPNEVVIFYLRDSFQEIIYLSQHCLSIS